MLNAVLPTLIVSEPEAVAARLDTLRLKEETLLNALTQANMYFVRLTAHHPLLYKYGVMTHETVAALRDLLVREGWEMQNDANYELVVNKGIGVAIAVASGNEGVGIINANPSNKSKKGKCTARAIDDNQTVDLFPETLPKKEELETKNKFNTWIFIFRRQKGVIYSELSRPDSYDDKMEYVTHWSERIILSPLDLGDPPVSMPVPDLPDIDINVTFKSAA